MLIALSLLTIAFAIAFVSLQTVNVKLAKEKAHLWWPLPIAGSLFALLTSLLLSIFDVPGLLLILFPALSVEAFEIEASLVLLSLVAWVIIGAIKRTSSKQPKRLLWPYFKNGDEVRARVGRQFYIRTLKFVILFLGALYAISMLVMYLMGSTSFALVTTLPLLAIIPLSEAYVYLMADVPEEEFKRRIGEREEVDHSLSDLWQNYVDTFSDYTVAWRSFSSPLNGNEGSSLSDDVKPLLSQDYILEDTDLVTAFFKLEPLYTAVENSGRYIFVAFDAPEHFKLDKDYRYIDAIADRLSSILSKKVVAFRQEFSSAKLENSIVVAPLSLLLAGRLSQDWLLRLGLITVCDIHDRGVANLYEWREFSFILRNVNPQCRLLFISSSRLGLQSSVMDTWSPNIVINEDSLRKMPAAGHFFFIAFDVENFPLRFGKLLSGWPAESLFPGSELTPIAVAGTFNGDTKHIWPVHLLEVPYSNIVEGMEQVRKSVLSFKPEVLNLSASSFDEKVVTHHLPVDIIDDKQVVSVIFDYENNAPASFLKWVHLGSKENFSMVLSKPYLFRDYFNANHSFFCDHPLQAIYPRLSKSRISLAIMLFNMLMQSEKEESEIRRLLIQYYNEDEIVSVPAIVSSLFQRYFGNDRYRSLSTKCLSHFDGSKYIYQTYYSINADHFPLPSYLNRISVVDVSGNTLFEISQDLLFQNYDKGQIHSFNGRPYEILNFSKADRTLEVRHLTGSNNVLFYRSCRAVEILGATPSAEEIRVNTMSWTHSLSGQEVALSLNCFETEMTVKTNAWYLFSRYSIVGNDCVRKSTQMEPRRYKNGKVLRMVMTFIAKKEYLDRKEDIRRGLQLLLHEALWTFFPHRAQYLLVTSLGDIDNDLPWIFPTFLSPDSEVPSSLSFYFVEDANIDLGLIGALVQDGTMRYIFEYLYDYLCWLTEKDSLTPKYFSQYLTRPSGLDHQAFLRYGRQNLPKYLDVELLLNFIRDFFDDVSSRRHDSRLKYLSSSESGGRFECDFCGREFEVSQLTQLSDGRMRCMDCSQNAIDTDEQFHALCREAENLFMKHLGVDFSKIPYTGHLVSAVELHRLYGAPFNITRGYDVRKILGFARDSRHDEFFVENGNKHDETLSIICHEMTHVWQFNTPQFTKFRDDKKLWVEGLAVWTDLFLMEKYGRPNIEQLRKAWLEKDDEYGNGLRLILSTCPNDPYGYILKY